MAEGNGVDLAAIYQLLGTVAADVRTLKEDVQYLKLVKADKSEVADLRAELRGSITDLRGEMRASIADLRQTIVEYHSSVIGHGILISELDERVRRLERRVDAMNG